jgi:triacylglycerol lipase
MTINSRVLNRAIFLSAVTFQAAEQFENKGSFVLPKGFKLVTRLGGSSFLGFIIQSKQAIIISFRGTEDLADIFRDVKFIQKEFPFVLNAGKTHYGFTKVYSNIVRKSVIDALMNLSSRKKLFVVGHSLGGALATLCALDVAVNTTFKQPILYTFGSPRVGNPTFVSTFNHTIEQSTRVTNTFDIVPRFPPRSLLNMKYQHVKNEFSLHFLFYNPLNNHEITNYFNKLCHLHPTSFDQLYKRDPKLYPSNSLKKLPAGTPRIIAD